MQVGDLGHRVEARQGGASIGERRAISAELKGLREQAANDVLRELVRNRGVIMVTFVPQFVNADPAAASLDDVLGEAHHGVRVVERVPLLVPPTPESGSYLDAKRRKLGHLLG